MSNNGFFRRSFDLPIFREQALMIAAAVVSLMLQVISFFTTLEGARVYFETAFAYAPLFFALSVQTVVYFLANGIRRRVTPAKVLALTLAVCCSSYFSFTGIYSSVNPPEQYLETTYNGYSRELSLQLEEIRHEQSSSDTALINRAVNGVISSYTSLTAQRSSLESLLGEIASVEAQTVYGMTAPKRSDYMTYEEYAAAYGAYISGISQGSAEEQRAAVQALLSRYGLSDASEVTQLLSEIEADLSLIEGTVTSAAGGGEVTAAAERARQRMLGGDKTVSQRIFSLYENITGNKLGALSESGAEQTELYLPPYEEISAGEPAAVVRERLSVMISDACDAVNAVGGSADASLYTFENVYTLPVYAVLSSSFGADAVISLILALLVDLLSLLFAMIFVKQRSVLAAKDTEQAISMSDDLFERNIVTALQIGICSEGGSFSGEWSSEELSERLAKFICCFRAEDFAAEQGYSMAADREALAGFEALTAFLCQFGLAKTLSGEEMSLLTAGECEAPSVLLKTKFLLWVSETSGADKRLEPIKKGAVTA